MKIIILQQLLALHYVYPLTLNKVTTFITINSIHLDEL